MHSRTHLPRASTIASVASTIKESTQAASSATTPAAAVPQQQLLQVLQQIESLDTQKLFFSDLTADGHLCVGGPQVSHTFRCLKQLSLLCERFTHTITLSAEHAQTQAPPVLAQVAVISQPIYNVAHHTFAAVLVLTCFRTWFATQ